MTVTKPRFSHRCFSGVAAVVLSLPASLAIAHAAPPSFDCATAQRGFEKAICADAALSQLDVEIGRAYQSALSKLRAEDREALKTDQRLFASGNSDAYEAIFYGAGRANSSSSPTHPADARQALQKRLQDRLILLRGLDPDRKGVLGLWLSHDTRLLVTEASPGRAGEHRVQLAGYKIDPANWPHVCDFGVGRIKTGKPNRDRGITAPRDLRGQVISLDATHFADRRGIRLEIDPANAQKPQTRGASEDCTSQIHTPDAVLFPVKPTTPFDIDVFHP